MEIAIVVAIIGALGALVAAAIGAWATTRASRRSQRPRKPELSLIDFGAEWLPVLSDRRRLSLDFRVRNTGGQPGLISRIKISCPRSLVFRQPTSPTVYEPQVGAALAASMGVDVDVDIPRPSTEPFFIDRRLSQRIPPNDIDRFLINISAPQPRRGEAFLYVLSCCLQDADRVHQLHTSNILAANPGFPNMDSCRDRQSLRNFLAAVATRREAINRQQVSAGLPGIDWSTGSSQFCLKQVSDSAYDVTLPSTSCSSVADVVNSYLTQYIDALRPLQGLILLGGPFVRVEGQAEAPSVRAMQAEIDVLEDIRDDYLRGRL